MSKRLDDRGGAASVTKVSFLFHHKGKAKKNQQTCLFSLNLPFNFSFEKLFQINTYTHT